MLSYVNESTSKRLLISNRSRQQLSMLLSDIKQCSQSEMDSRDSWKEFGSVEAYVTGIMFYGGRENLRPLLKVKLVLWREMENPHDCNAIKVLVPKERQLGYTQLRDATKVLAPLMDN